MDIILPEVDMPFADYRKACLAHIAKKRRHWLHHDHDYVIDMNAPFEQAPAKEQDIYDVGVLYAHGLLESPFSFREFALSFANESIFCRAILLPGHGTDPRHLMQISLDDWLQTMTYGIESMRHRVKRLYLMGFSTGAALAVYQALTRSDIAGLLLIAPAIQIKIPLFPLFQLQKHMPEAWFKNRWLVEVEENDYIKYRSIAYQGVHEVWELGNRIEALLSEKPCTTPIWMGLSENDETISSTAAIDFFKRSTNTQNQLLLYTTAPTLHTDKRITQRRSAMPEKKIEHFSHISLPFSASNPHYGVNGDFPEASMGHQNHSYGAYLGAHGYYQKLLQKLGYKQETPVALTYNPDFDFMLASLLQFIKDDRY